MSGTLTIYAIVASDIEYWTGHFNETIPPSISSSDVRKIATLSINTPSVQELVRNILKGGNIHALVLNEIKNSIDTFYHDKEFYVISSGLNNIENLDKFVNKSKSAKRIQDMNNPRSFVSRKTFLDRYLLRGTDKNLPYKNYDTNASENRCVLQYVSSKYKKASVKYVNKLFDVDEVTMFQVKEFCIHYKINLCVRNVLGRVITQLHYPTNKNYPDFNCIIANNHLYPCNSLISKPEFYEDDERDVEVEIDEDEREETDITIYDKTKTHYCGGTTKQHSDTIIDKTFFDSIHPNFTYKSEIDLKFRAIMYSVPQEVAFEIDVKKCYYTVATSYIPTGHEVPIFTVLNTYIEYKNQKVLDICYYLISKKALDNLKTLGFITNSMSGYMVNLLIENNYLTRDDIEYFKTPSYLKTWGVFVARIDVLAEKMVKKIEGESNDDRYKRVEEFKKTFVLYNGLLGRVLIDKTQTITNIKKEDEPLLNWRNNIEEETEEEEDEAKVWSANSYLTDYTEFTSNKKPTYKYNNLVNMYDTIVEQSSILILSSLFAIMKANPNATLLKIKTDALGFDRVVKIPKEYEKWFRVETDINQKNFTPIHLYHNGREIIDNVTEELNILSNNVSYHGAPGTGKTFTVKSNHKFDKSATVTNVCANMIGGTTIFSLFGLYSPVEIHKYILKLANKTVWIDEWSMIPAVYWGYLFMASALYKTKYIISGDKNQIGPVNEKKIDINDNRFFEHMFGTQTTLTKDWRNDDGLINLRNEILLATDEQALGNKIYKHIETKPFETYERHVSFTHITRIAVNQSVLNKHNYKYKHCYINDDNGVSKYDKLEVSTGVILRSRSNEKKSKIYKGEMWRVISQTDKEFTLLNLVTETENTLPLSMGRYFTLGFCVTAHSSQGLTIREDFAIHNTIQMIMTDKDLLYTAVTRGCEKEKLHLFAHKKDYYLNIPITYTATEPGEINEIENPFEDVYGA